MRARQAAELLAHEDAGEAGIRALLQLSHACLDTGDAGAAAQAAEVAQDRAAALAEPVRSQLIGCAALLAGIAHAAAGAERAARVCLDEARERLVAADEPEGAALALTQQALLDVATGQLGGAQICFGFARDFYRAAHQPAAAVELAALAARALAALASADADGWFREAIAGADRTLDHELAAELVVELAQALDRAGARAQAAEVAADAARRCAALGATYKSRALALAARLQLAQWTNDPIEAMRHVEAAFELALELREPAPLAAAMDVLVAGLVHGRFADVGWRLVDQFRERLGHTGFAALAETAVVALAALRA